MKFAINLLFKIKTAQILLDNFVLIKVGSLLRERKSIPKDDLH